MSLFLKLCRALLVYIYIHIYIYTYTFFPFPPFMLNTARSHGKSWGLTSHIWDDRMGVFNMGGWDKYVLPLVHNDHTYGTGISW